MTEQQQFYEAKLNFETDSWDLYEAINRGENVIIIDARSTESFENEHIPGSINFPYRKITVESTQHLNKDSLYVTYCDGIGCNASTKGALNLTKLGFRVKELLGGIDWWKRDGYVTEGHKANDGKQIACGC